MVKFSGTTRRPRRTNPTASIRTTFRRTRTHEGGEAHVPDPRSELFLLAATNLVGEDTFYERATDRDARFRALVHEVTAVDPAFLAGDDPDAGRIGLIQYVRQALGMRSAAVVLAAEYVAAGGPGGRSVVARASSGPTSRPSCSATGSRPTAATSRCRSSEASPMPCAGSTPSGPPSATTAGRARSAWPT